MLQIKLLTRDIDIDGKNITARISFGTNYLYNNKPDEILINDYLVTVDNVECEKSGKLFLITLSGYCCIPELTAAALPE